MLFCTLQLLLVLTVAPRYGLLAGWLRRRRMVPQQVLEDVLDSVLRGESESVPLGRVAQYVPGRMLPRAVRSLVRDSLLRREGDSLSFTESGRKEALRIRRAHRLWEAYLAHVGTPADQLHERAEILEHTHTEEALGYLDDLLGNPSEDPHGQAIPEDPDRH